MVELYRTVETRVVERYRTVETRVVERYRTIEIFNFLDLSSYTFHLKCILRQKCKKQKRRKMFVYKLYGQIVVESHSLLGKGPNR